VQVLCLGELLVDCFGCRQFPGGAPANVAHHIASLGESVAILSRVGEDEAGGKLANWLASKNIGTQLLQYDGSQPTGVVTVLPGPRYEIAAPAAWDFIELTEDAHRSALAAGVLVFGTLAQRHPVSRRTIRALVEAARSRRVPVLCDLNLRAPFHDEESVLWSLRHCDVLKLNREELGVVSHMLRARGESEDIFTGLLREFGIGGGVLTAGAAGAWFCQDGELFHQPASEPSCFVDAVGAGDAFAAVIAIAISRGIPLRQAAGPASLLAAAVVAQSGANPEVSRELLARLNAVLAV